MRHPIVRGVAWYVGLGVAALAATVVLLKLYAADLNVPFCPYGDGLVFLAWAKTVLEQGWYLTNTRLSAPFVQHVHDYPMIDSLHFFGIKLLGLLGLSPAAAYNGYYILGYPLGAVSAAFVLSRLSVPFLPAACLGLLYTFLPYHFQRGAGHMFLASYYLVPLQVLLMLRVFQGQALVTPREGSVWRMNRLSAWPIVGLVLISVVSASAGVYYAYFTCYFLILAGFAGACRHRSVAPAVAAGLLVLATCASVGANLLPTLIYQASEGSNAGAVQRHPAGPEVYGLRITQLLLPAIDHRKARLAGVTARYYSYVQANEAVTATLGVVGALGFLALLGRFMARRFLTSPADLGDCLGFLTLGGLALATVGSFGSLLALLLTDHIRGYNRISVFLSFFALVAVGLFLTWLQSRISSVWGRCAFAAGVLVLLLGGVYDQLGTRRSAQLYAATKQSWTTDRAYFEQVEASLPQGAMVFQYPPHPFPEVPAVNGINPYDHLRGYVHTERLRWSYGAIKGRYGIRWQEDLEKLEVRLFADRLAMAGFDALYVDFAMCTPKQKAFANALASLLGMPPVRSNDGRLAVYSFAAYRESNQGRYSESDREQVLQAVLPSWEEGFSILEPEADPPSTGRWCAHSGRFLFLNPSAETRTVEIAFEVYAPTVDETPLRLGGLVKETVSIGRQPKGLRYTLQVPPGNRAITFACKAPRVMAQGDPRIMVFRVRNFQFQEVQPPAAQLTTRAAR